MMVLNQNRMMTTTVGVGQRDRRSEAGGRDLVDRAGAGDIGAFTEIVELYQRPVYNLCCRYLGVQDGEDAAQETFIKAFVHRDRYHPDRPILPWLLTIARHLCLDRLRKHKTVALSENDERQLTAPEPNAEATLESKQTLRALQKGLLTLKEGPREAVALYHLEGMSYRGISEILGVPEGTVMTWLHRGRAKLRTFVEQADAGKRQKEGG